MEISLNQMEIIAVNNDLLTRIRHACLEDSRICILKLEQDIGRVWLTATTPEPIFETAYARLHQVLKMLDVNPACPDHAELVHEMTELTAYAKLFQALEIIDTDSGRGDHAELVHEMIELTAQFSQPPLLRGATEDWVDFSHKL